MVAAVATIAAGTAWVLAPAGHAQEVRYEAENSPAVCDGTIASNHSGYSGTGFCDTPNSNGVTVTFTVNATESGSATLGIRYANGSSGGARPGNIEVNGAVVQSLQFPVTGGWNVWSTSSLSVPVNVGDNTVRIVATNSAGLGNIDYLDAEPEIPPQQEQYEAEDAPAVCDGTIDSNHSGYSGTGFCNTPNNSGATVTFTVDALNAGTATLGIRYANGGSAARPGNVEVNGSVVQSVQFPATGSWSTWSTTSLTVPVNAGDNTVRIVATNSAGLGNIDYLDFTMGGDPGPGSDPYGYLFAYMLGEGSSNGEQVYFALSRGNNPLAYDALNGGQPVATSTVGERGARDPFIVRHPDTGRYYMIATDLRIYGNNDWNRASRWGSRSLVVWESSDLVNWTSSRLAQVSPPAAGNTWAPEAYWDPSRNAFVVYWASKLYSTSDHSDNTYHRMMYATTTDFRTFSTAQVWVDKGYSTIDSTVTEHNGTYYRYTKDERSGTSCGKFILSETSTVLTSTNWSFQRECIGSGTISQGEGPLVFKSNTENKWYMFIDEYGGRGYIPFETTNLAGGNWTPSSGYSLPGRPRHGMVLPLTEAQYETLQNSF